MILPSLQRAGEVTPGLLSQVLCPQVLYEKHGHTTESPLKDHKDEEGPGTPLL